MSNLRISAPEFTPTKSSPGNAFSRGLLRRNPMYEDNRSPMERRMWMAPNLKSIYGALNYWADSLTAGDTTDGQLPHELNGKYRDLSHWHALTLGFVGKAAAFVIRGCTHQVMTLRARRTVDNRIVMLQVVKNVVIEDAGPFVGLEKWRMLSCPFVAPIQESFTTRQLGGRDLVFVYEVPLGAKSCAAVNLASIPDPKAIQFQLLLALHTVHRAGLTLEGVLSGGQLSNVLISCTMDWIQLMGVGVLDVLRAAGICPPAADDVNQRQTADYQEILLLLHQINPNDLALQPELPDPHQYSWQELASLLSEHSIAETLLGQVYNRASLIEEELAKQLENDRLYRIVCKLGFVNERRAFAHDSQWSETGDRYVLKLFRDFVFHSEDELGQPVIDLSFVTDCLNKLDVGSSEIIALVSRDGSQCILTSYAEIKRRLNMVFAELQETAQ